MEIPLTLNSHAQLLWTSVRRKTTKSSAAPDEERKMRSWSRGGGGGGGLCLNRVALISINFAVGPRLLSPQYSVLSLTKRRKGPFAGEYLSVLYLHPCYLCSLECTNYVRTEYYLYVPGEMLQYNLRTTGIPLESPDSRATRSWSTYQEMKLFNHTNYATFPGLFLSLSLFGLSSMNWQSMLLIQRRYSSLGIQLAVNEQPTTCFGIGIAKIHYSSASKYNNFSVPLMQQ